MSCSSSTRRKRACFKFERKIHLTLFFSRTPRLLLQQPFTRITRSSFRILSGNFSATERYTFRRSWLRISEPRFTMPDTGAVRPAPSGLHFHARSLSALVSYLILSTSHPFRKWKHSLVDLRGKLVRSERLQNVLLYRGKWLSGSEWKMWSREQEPNYRASPPQIDSPLMSPVHTITIIYRRNVIRHVRDSLQ